MGQPNQIMILKLSKNTVILYYTIFTIFAHCVRPKCWLKNESLGILQSSSIKVHQTLFECNIESSIMRFLVQTSNFVSKLITCTLFIWMLAGENPKIKVVSKIRIVKIQSGYDLYSPLGSRCGNLVVECGS